VVERLPSKFKALSSNTSTAKKKKKKKRKKERKEDLAYPFMHSKT
jgi:hypothetical protein